MSQVNQEIDRHANPAKPAKAGEEIVRPDFIKHWIEIQDDKPGNYKGSDELLSLGSALGKKLGLTKIGIHHEVLPAGRRTSWPHAESAEEEFGFVIEGNPRRVD